MGVEKRDPVVICDGPYGKVPAHSKQISKFSWETFLENIGKTLYDVQTMFLSSRIDQNMNRVEKACASSRALVGTQIVSTHACSP